MKKAITIITFSLLVFACSRKTVSTSSTVPATTTSSTINETSAGPNSVTAHAELVEQGKGIFTTKCSKCHATKDVTAYTQTRWEGILQKMIPKAKLNETESQQVTAYVMEYAAK
jgi:cytochrome c5